VLKHNTYKSDIMTREHGRKYDGRSRPTNDTYAKRWEEIFGNKKEELEPEDQEYLDSLKEKL
jgi:hypothetical protein